MILSSDAAGGTRRKEGLASPRGTSSRPLGPLAGSGLQGLGAESLPRFEIWLPCLIPLQSLASGYLGPSLGNPRASK